uniref:Putative mediator of rna polymerase ii transcription subunit 15 n=1 Tax=Anopheles darlingi TaxID=43151 RepID=A0A2M4CR04_ANODA
MERVTANSKSKDKKWSLGSLFRKKKKDLDTDSSSEEDRKAGFVPVKGHGTLNGKRKKRSSRIVGAGFDHIVVSPQPPPQQLLQPVQQQVLLPHQQHHHHPQQQQQQQQQQHTPQQHHNQYGFRESDSINSIDRYTANGSLDRRTGRKEVRGGGIVRRNSKERQSSSDEESHRSSSMSRFRSDDSLGNHSAGSHRKSRTARTERYLKRMSGRDDGHSPQQQHHHQALAPGHVNRWHTQPISPSMLPHGGSIQSVDVAYRRPATLGSHPNLRNSASLTNVHGGVHGHQLRYAVSPSYSHQLQLQQQQLPYASQSPPNPQTVTYENSFYIQSKASSMRDAIRSPPPIPPRDPQRRLTIGHTNEARPVSYAFDRYHQLQGANGANGGSNIWQSNGKCNSEDRLWVGGQSAMVQRTPPPPSMHGGAGFTVTPPRASSVQPAELHQQHHHHHHHQQQQQQQSQQPQQQKQRYISRQQQPQAVVHPPSTPPSNVAYHHHQHHQQQQQQYQQHQQQQQPHYHHAATLPVQTPPTQQQQRPGGEWRYITDVTPRSRKPIQVQDRTFEPYEPKRSPQPAPTGSESSLVYSGNTTPSGIATRSTPRSVRADSSESVNGTASGSRTPQQSASAFWRKIEEEQSAASGSAVTTANRRGRATERRPGVAGTAVSSRSVSTSRALEIMNRRNQELTRELDHLLDDKQQQQQQQQQQQSDENVVSGRLYLRQADANQTTVRSPNEKMYEVKVKTSSRPLNGADTAAAASSPEKAANKYEEHVAKTVAGSQTVYRRYGGDKQPEVPAPTPPMRTISKRNSCSEEELARKRKSANLEEAISELEAIYKSLKLSDEDLLERAEQRDVPTPTGFSHRARTYRYDPDPEDDRAKPEPDLRLDDLSYRSIKRANSSLKTTDNQPPFGIPVGPIPPPPTTDYLTVQPPSKQQTPRFVPRQSPDLVADDLAFRQLRKDKDLHASLDRKPAPATTPTTTTSVPVSGNTSSGSEESRVTKRNSGSTYYTQIQRDAAKPSGGNLEDYYKLELYAKSLRESSSPAKTEKTQQKKESTSGASSQTVEVRAKSGSPPKDRNRGAVFNLPSTLKSSSSGSPPKSPRSSDGGSEPSSVTPTPRPRSGTEPVIVGAKHKAEFEEILNAIALEAQNTSEKLGADLAELRKETLSVSSGTSPETKPNRRNAVSKTVAGPAAVVAATDVKVTQKHSNEIDQVAEAAKYCEQMLRGVIEETGTVKAPSVEPEVAKVVPEVTMIGRVILDKPTIVIESKVVEEPVVDVPTEPVQPMTGELKSGVSSAVEGLIAQLTPAGSFEALSKRCQEQLSELEDPVTSDGGVAGGDERVKSSIERDYDNLVESINPFESDTDKKSTEEEIDLIMKECGIELELSSASSVAPAQSKSLAAIPGVQPPQKVTASAQVDLGDIDRSVVRERVSSVECLKPSVIAAEQRKRSSSSRSPPVSSSVRLTPSDTESQYNSSEELAMIFGIKSPSPPGKGATPVRVPLLSLSLLPSCATSQPPKQSPSSKAPSDPEQTTQVATTVPSAITSDEHDGGEADGDRDGDDGVVFSVTVPSISHLARKLPSTTITTTTTTSTTVASVACRSATNSINACNNTVTTNQPHTTSTTTTATNTATTQHDSDTSVTTHDLEEDSEVHEVEPEPMAQIESFYLMRSSTALLPHNLDTIHEDLEEETNPADGGESTTTDSGNVSLNDFGCEGTVTKEPATFVNEMQIGPPAPGLIGYYPFRSVLQIPEIFIEDVSTQEDEEEQEEQKVEESTVSTVQEAGSTDELSDTEDPQMETFAELERLEAERLRQEAVRDALVPKRSTNRNDGSSCSRTGRTDGGATKRKGSSSSNSSSLVQPQHVVLACTYGLANSNIDYINVFAIIIAIIILFALMVI